MYSRNLESKNAVTTGREHAFRSPYIYTTEYSVIRLPARAAWRISHMSACNITVTDWSPQEKERAREATQNAYGSHVETVVLVQLGIQT